MQHSSQALGLHQESVSGLARLSGEVSRTCTRCATCQKGCAFLRKHGTPGELATACNPSVPESLSLSFTCSLCGLCAAVCPEKLNPAELFLEMRRVKARQDPLPYREHTGFLAYERRSTSWLFTHYALPQDCEAVFFPGCALAGTRAEKTIKLYDHLRKDIPSLGIVLDCCMKISHDLGREEQFRARFQEMKEFLLQKGIRRIIVACPNCYRMFRTYGEGLKVRTVYEVMEALPLPQPEQVSGVVTVHDPCPLRFSPEVQAAVRNLLKKQGLTVEEMPHAGENTLCCGEGGFVGALSPVLSEKWGELLKEEAAGRRGITYCAGCTNHLDGRTPTSHVIDLFFAPQATLAGTIRVARAPLTYLNRLKLKKQFQKKVAGPVRRERTSPSGGGSQGGGKGKRFLLLGVLLALILAARYTGVMRYLEQETLRQWIQSYGGVAPVVYMLIYALAPSLLLPGLPLTIAGGILFGPFWGVVYAITGATVGACLAFLVARYLARDWVERKLSSPRWRRLDGEVEKHGWKVVAFTRLIPLFPFNLLNYAFGLTGIRFLPYAVATFFGMLPACIAFIVFSSSLLDLLRGRASFSFVVGLVMVVLVSLLPLFYRFYKRKKGLDEP